MKKWVGVHDHANFSAKWVDQDSPYSWLRTFEKLIDRSGCAYLRDKNITYSVRKPIRNVFYNFYNVGFSYWVNDIIAESPSLILYNICWYAEAEAVVNLLKRELQNTSHVIRIHHDVSYLKHQKGFKETVNACDFAIVPTLSQISELRKIGFKGEIYSLSFGVDVSEFVDNRVLFSERSIDIISSTNSHPARNKPLLEKIFNGLKSNNYKVKNIIDLPRGELSKFLGDSKFFLLTSMTEASGSRIMLEAIAAGCYPIAFDECKSAKEVITELGVGALIKTGMVLKMPNKKISSPWGVSRKIIKEIQGLYNEVGSDFSGFELGCSYDYNCEVKELLAILKKCE